MFIKKGTKVLPNDGTVTDRLPQWHVPPKRVITLQTLEYIQLKKVLYGKTTRRSSRRSHPYNHEADMPAVQSLVTNVLLACPPEILPTLKTFYLNALVPEILTRRIQKELFLTGTTAVD